MQIKKCLGRNFAQGTDAVSMGLLAVLLFGGSGLLRAQQGSQVPAARIYEETLQRLFPDENGGEPGEVFMLCILLRSSLRPESQIVIRQGRGATGTVLYRRADRNISNAVNQWSREGVTSDEISTRLHVFSQTVIVPARQTFEWQQAFRDGLSASLQALQQNSKTQYGTGVVSVTLDADTYELRYMQGLVEISGRFPDSISESADARKRPVSAWASDMFREVDRLTKRH
jgi:hypothetical protein